MGRPRQFDVDEVLQGALELFWAGGYEVTSVQELVDATGVGRQSLYDTFGDKRGLYLQSLHRYASHTVREVARPLMDPDAAFPAIRDYFASQIRFLTGDTRHRSCFLVNTLMELGDSDAEITGFCAARQQDLHALLEQALSRARERGEIDESGDPEEIALLLLNHGNGLALLARTGRSADELERATAALLERL